MKNADQPAFAQSFATDKDGNMYSAHEKDSRNAGMSKREYFSAIAMQGILSGIYGGGGDNYLRQMTEWHKYGSPLDSVGTAAARDAIGYADELLKQLES